MNLLYLNKKMPDWIEYYMTCHLPLVGVVRFEKWADVDPNLRKVRSLCCAHLICLNRCGWISPHYRLITYSSFCSAE